MGWTHTLTVNCRVQTKVAWISLEILLHLPPPPYLALTPPVSLFAMLINFSTQYWQRHLRPLWCSDRWFKCFLWVYTEEKLQYSTSLLEKSVFFFADLLEWSKRNIKRMRFKCLSRVTRSLRSLHVKGPLVRQAKPFMCLFLQFDCFCSQHKRAAIFPWNVKKLNVLTLTE